jgi:hypothetical protein
VASSSATRRSSSAMRRSRCWHPGQGGSAICPA